MSYDVLCETEETESKREPRKLNIRRRLNDAVCLCHRLNDAVYLRRRLDGFRALERVGLMHCGRRHI